MTSITSGFDELGRNAVLLVLSGEATAASDKALCKFADFLGVRAQLIFISGEGTKEQNTLTGIGYANRHFAISFQTLKDLAPQSWFSSLLQEAESVFVYGFSPIDHCEELARLTGGVITSIVSVETKKKDYTVHAPKKGDCFPISGKSFSVESSSVSLAFSCQTGDARIETYMSVNGSPCLVSVQHGRTQLFLFPGSLVVDIDKSLSSGSTLREWYDQLLTMAIFLRSVFPSSCWTSPITGATVIIDDPYIKQRYGFLHYETLLRKLHETECSLTVGFIPYNYRRSDVRITELLRRHSDRFSITVHGCEHTAGEFASSDAKWLLAKSDCALKRMEAHKKLTQMPYDDIMIFPQGRFSKKAIKALKQCHYLAAVNTTPWPVDSGESPLTIRDLLDVAVTRYESFPIFVRRYPRDTFDFAFDAFFQKPILVVEHHDFFRDGYTALQTLVRDLDALDIKLSWMPLRKTLMSSYLFRQIASNHQQVRFFTPKITLHNPANESCLFSLAKAETSQDVDSVFLGENRVAFAMDSGVLRFEARLAPGETIESKVQYRAREDYPYKPSLKYRTGVIARRLLSETRDNWLSHNKSILTSAMKIKAVLSKRNSS